MTTKKSKSKFDGLGCVTTFTIYKDKRTGIEKLTEAMVADYVPELQTYCTQYKRKYIGFNAERGLHHWEVDIFAIPESRLRRGVTGIRCGKCRSEVVSLSHHDFRYCRCESCFLDGGFEYSRVGWTPGVVCEYLDCVVDMGTGKILESKRAVVREPTAEELIEMEPGN